MKNKPIRKFVWLPNGKKDSATFKLKTNADAWLARRKADIQKAKALGLDDIVEITFDEAADKWLAYSQINNQQKTNYEYQSIVTAHLKPMFAKKKLNSLRRPDAEKLIANLASKCLRPKTILKIYGVLKTIIKHSISNNHLAKDPFIGVKTPRMKDKRIHYLTEIEAEKLLEVSKNTEFYGIVFLTLNNGLRLGEILGLQWDCVDLKRKRLTIARSLDRYGIKEHTKNGKHRELPMSDVVFEYLTEFKRQRPFEKIVFSDKGEFWNPDHFKQRHFDPLVKQAEIRACRFHDLRHTFATHYMQNKGSLFDLQKLLGHQRIENTLIYAHHSIEHLQNSAQIVQFGRGEVKTREVKTTPEPNAVNE